MTLATKSAMARTAWALITAAALAVGSSGCGSEVSSRAIRTQPDMSKLDVGNYQVQPRHLGNARNHRQARAREAQRLADYVILPYEADPSYVEDVWLFRSHVVLNRKTLGNLVINDTFDDVAKDLVAGWVNAWSTAPEGEKQRTANIAVLMFPDARAAQEVGPALEHDDFTYNPDNQPVALTKHANTYAHWRPGVSSIGSWTVYNRYVIFIKIEDDTSAPDLPALTGHVERLLDAQIPVLGKFEPTPAADLSRIPLDPHGVMGRTLPGDPESQFRPEPDSYYAGRGILTLLFRPGPSTLTELESAEIEFASFGSAVVFRSRTAKGAAALWDNWRFSKDLGENQKLVDPPAGLEQRAECIEEYVGAGEDRLLSGHLCILLVDRHVVQARSKQLPDLHQRMSAQYALLASD